MGNSAPFAQPRKQQGEIMGHFLSIIIPNHNGSRTIGACLEAVFAARNDDVEVVVVDDCSIDGSVGIIGKYPCKLIRLERHAGASAARNAGAAHSKGDILFFIDADCLLTEDTLPVIRNNLALHPPDVVLGGTYTPVPQDPGFFSLFQSVFINYSETRNSGNPDYIATHAMVIRAETFKKTGGFSENFLPILEDVEFSHRLRRAGCRLVMDPDLRVRHIFNFSFARSMRNAVKKTRHWIAYSLGNRDLFSDSGTASREIKANGIAWLSIVLLTLLFLASGQVAFLAAVPLIGGMNIILNRGLFKAFFRAGGAGFAIAAAAYYMTIYPAAVWTGTAKGVLQYFLMKKTPGRNDARGLNEGPAKE